ncbi:MAG: MlaA family lipoprotein [Marinobacterium sp.]
MRLSSLRTGTLALGLGAAVASLPAVAESEQDPWEGFNRSVFEFNETIDRYAMRPIANGYRYVTPDIVEQGVSNFFGNVAEIGDTVNSLLQLKFDDAGSSFARLTFNTTFGLLGVLDVATPMGIESQDEDFGQTLGYWGVESGPYLVLPFIGASTVRDGAALAVDFNLDPVGLVDDVPTRNSLYALQLVDLRSRLLKAEQIISGDRYSFVRDAYLQRRAYMINDGAVSVQYDQDF